MENIFTGGFDISRANPIGLALLVIAVIIVAAAPVFAKKQPEEKRQKYTNIIKLIGLAVCFAGAAVAILA